MSTEQTDLAKLREEAVNQILFSTFAEGQQHLDRYAEAYAKAKLAKAQEDAARLDWLEANMGEPMTWEDAPHSICWAIYGEPGCNKLRAAIDAARKEGSK